jgi:hypothetical protein
MIAVLVAAGIGAVFAGARHICREMDAEARDL